MFNPDFYPTPPEVAAEMLDCLDLRGRVVLEPSAGSGNLVRECLARGAVEVLWCEAESKLRSILRSIRSAMPAQGCSDFLRVDAADVSHIDLVVMNPPFSADEAHILHAWEIAPPGCEIVALCNWNTIDGWRGNSLTARPGTRLQQQLSHLIESYGSSECLGECFTAAERPTKVSVGLVRLRKPGQRVSAADEFDGFFLGPDDIEAQGEGIIPYRRSRDIVNRYVEACRIYDEQVEAGTRLRTVLDGFFGQELGLQVTVEGAPVTRNRFRKDLQKAAWKHVFAEFLPAQLATSQLAKDINAFVEKQSRIPFTERNIYRMLQIVAGTQEQRVDRAVEQAIDSLTQHTAENRYGVEGWVTNSGYMLNRRFIRSYLAEVSWSGRGVNVKSYGGQADEIQDLIKALCFITGRSYDEVGQPTKPADGIFWPGDWYEWGFFRFKAHKKGTVHFEFKDREVWAAVNARYARIKGQVLPEQHRRKATRRHPPVTA
jgi:16S rRNA A1518/A1519 N6-dimethyltransferase RsmA/KsgA/DIM1 with predicted DNA glycosylase/AP lyase activity